MKARDPEVAVPASRLLCCTREILFDVVTVKLTPLLTMPFTATTTLPVVAPVGTGATILVAFQLVGVAAVPLNLIVLVPCEAPKLAPVIVTEVPTAPAIGFRLVMLGTAPTVKSTPLLGTPPTSTTTFPVVAPVGTGAVILVLVQFDALGCTPLNVTKLWILPTVGPKFVPVMITFVPTGPAVGLILVIAGAGVTVKVTPLLATPLTVMTTFPVVAPVGTVTSMLLAVQLTAVIAAPLRVTLLLP